MVPDVFDELKPRCAVLTRVAVVRLDVSVLLAQAVSATTGVVDTRVMGLQGDAADPAGSPLRPSYSASSTGASGSSACRQRGLPRGPVVVVTPTATLPRASGVRQPSSMALPSVAGCSTPVAPARCSRFKSASTASTHPSMSGSSLASAGGRLASGPEQSLRNGLHRHSDSCWSVARWWCLTGCFVGVVAWPRDGLFIGTTQGQAWRNAALASAILHVGSDMLPSPVFGNDGVGAAFLAMYVFRAVALGVYVPGLLATRSQA